MRRLLALALLGLALPLAAQPPNLEPLPEPPPPPPGYELDPALEPQVTVSQRGEDKVEEFRVKGRLYAIRVTPRHGVPYFLLDQNGDGALIRRDSLDSGLRVPEWLIHSF